MQYQELKLKRYRVITVFSILFLTFFRGKFYKTDELFGWTNVRQQKIKYREKYFNEWYYQEEWSNWKTKWIKV